MTVEAHRRTGPVDLDQRVGLIMRLHGEGKNAYEIADHLGLKLVGLRKWLRNHELRDVMDTIRLVPKLSDVDRRRANAAKASRAAAARRERMKDGTDAREVAVVAEAARLLEFGESPAQIAKQLGVAVVTMHRYATDVRRVARAAGADAAEVVGVTVDECARLQRDFGREHAAEVAFRQGQQQPTQYGRSA